MSESESSAPDDPAPRWLSPEERATWLSLVGVMVKLPAALDAQLQRDSGLSYFEYMVLAMLSEQPDRLMRMSELAAAINASLSRLSHIAKRLEGQGFITRRPDLADVCSARRTWLCNAVIRTARDPQPYGDQQAERAR